MRKRFSAVQWTAWLQEFDGSGLSVAEFCEQIDVGQNSFYFWRRKLATQDDVPTEHFVPVVVRPVTQVSIDFPCGAVLRVDNHVDALKPVIETLAQVRGTQA